MRPTLTAPVPMAAAASGGGTEGGGLLLSSSEVLEQAVSKASRPPTHHRRDENFNGACGAGTMDAISSTQMRTQCQSTLANGHNEDDRLTEWKG
jgi:hypothetical protein